MAHAADRQKRHAVSFQARIREGGTWHEMMICNVSRRGLMLKGRAGAPQRGTYVEIRRGSQTIIGQVRWASGNRCGVKAREDIDLSNWGVDRSAGGEGGSPRSQAVIVVRRPTAADVAARSRLAARGFNFALLLMLGIAAAALTESVVSSVLAPSLGQVSRGLGSK